MSVFGFPPERSPGGNPKTYFRRLSRIPASQGYARDAKRNTMSVSHDKFDFSVDFSEKLTA